MKVERFILRDLYLPTDAPGKSWGVPIKGDVMMVFDLDDTYNFYVVKTIKHVEEGTRYSLLPISSRAVESRKQNSYCCFSVKKIKTVSYPLIEFCKTEVKW